MERTVGRKAYLGADCIVSSLGVGTEQNIRAILNYESKLSRWHDGTLVSSIDPMWPHSGYTQLEWLAIATVEEVLRKSGTDLTDPRSLLILSTTKGNIDHITEPQTRDIYLTAQRIADHFRAAAEPRVISNACISGVSAIIVAARLVECDEYERVVVVGIDSLTDFVVSGFKAFKSLSPTNCRPFDAARDGLTLGQACGAVMVTSEHTDVEVAGGAISCDANHISGPSRTGDGLHIAIRAAMADAGISPEELAFVNAHGTATVFNDEMESRALDLSGLLSLPCNSLKPYFGHTLGAAGVVESIICAHQLRRSVVFAVPNYEQNGVPHELNISAEHRPTTGKACLKMASGFGGSNAAMILKLSDSEPRINSSTSGTITLRGSVSISKDSEKPFAETIRAQYKALGEPYPKFYKMDELCKLGYVAAEKLLREVGVESYPPHRIALVLSSANSSLDSDLRHQNIIDQNPTEGASPAVFVYTLANIVAGEIAIRHKIQGECTFFIEPDKKSNFTAKYARFLLQSGVADAVVYGWCDLLGEEYDAELSLITI